MKQGKIVAGEALQIAEERRKVKGKGEKGKYTHVQSSKEYQGEIRKPSSVISAKQ